MSLNTIEGMPTTAAESDQAITDADVEAIARQLADRHPQPARVTETREERVTRLEGLMEKLLAQTGEMVEAAAMFPHLPIRAALATYRAHEAGGEATAEVDVVEALTRRVAALEAVIAGMADRIVTRHLAVVDEAGGEHVTVRAGDTFGEVSVRAQAGTDDTPAVTIAAADECEEPIVVVVARLGLKNQVLGALGTDHPYGETLRPAEALA